VQADLDTIRSEILDAIANDQLVLPTMPEVALRLREEVENENSTVHSIAKVIGNDAALTARIIRIANSPLVRGVQTVEDLQMAVSRMGMEYTANLAIGIAMEQLFQATSDAVDERMRKTWAHSTDVASLSHVLCQHFTSLKPDQATLAGLIHEIGKLPILAWADDHEWDDDTIETVTEALHPEIGRIILESWDFPPELQAVPEQYTQFDRLAEAADYVDVVMVANLHSYAGKEHPFADMDWAKIHAFENLGISIDVILEDESELEDEVSAAKGLLS
jgi:HD-like signal output (HDOD) protein